MFQLLTNYLLHCPNRYESFRLWRFVRYKNADLMKVSNLTSPRTGCEVANQFLIEDGNVRYFQSYKSVIVKVEYAPNCPPKVTLDARYWNYSVTTSKYRNQFLHETTTSTQAKIKSGEFVLANLN